MYLNFIGCAVHTIGPSFLALAAPITTLLCPIMNHERDQPWSVFCVTTRAFYAPFVVVPNVGGRDTNLSNLPLESCSCALGIVTKWSRRRRWSLQFCFVRVLLLSEFLHRRRLQSARRFFSFVTVEKALRRLLWWGHKFQWGSEGLEGFYL